MIVVAVVSFTAFVFMLFYFTAKRKNLYEEDIYESKYNQVKKL